MGLDPKLRPAGTGTTLLDVMPPKLDPGFPKISYLIKACIVSKILRALIVRIPVKPAPGPPDPLAKEGLPTGGSVKGLVTLCVTEAFDKLPAPIIPNGSVGSGEGDATPRPREPVWEPPGYAEP